MAHAQGKGKEGPAVLDQGHFRGKKKRKEIEKGRDSHFASALSGRKETRRLDDPALLEHKKGGNKEDSACLPPRRGGGKKKVFNTFRYSREEPHGILSSASSKKKRNAEKLEPYLTFRGRKKEVIEALYRASQAGRGGGVSCSCNKTRGKKSKEHQFLLQYLGKQEEEKKHANK